MTLFESFNKTNLLSPPFLVKISVKKIYFEVISVKTFSTALKLLEFNMYMLFYYWYYYHRPYSNLGLTVTEGSIPR